MASDDETPEYLPRSEDEMAALERSFRSSGARNYTAPPAPGYDVHGLWHCFNAGSRSGYAAHATALHWMLGKALHVPTQLVPHRSIDIDIERFPEDRYGLLFDWTKEAVGIPHALFASFPLEIAADMEGVTANLVPYCAYEGTKIGSHARQLATGPIFSSIWVVSAFVKQAFVAAGVEPSRVNVVRPMLTEGPWSMTPLPLLGTRKNRPVTSDDPFIFGVVGTWQRRKGMHDLLRAYFGAFRREEHVRLRIKTSPFFEAASMTVRKFKDKVVSEIAAIAGEFGDHEYPASQKMPRVTLDIGTELTDQQLITYIGDFDCFVSPSYGEGLGIPQVWAKAQGVPVVSTGYGAVGEMVNEIASVVRSCQDHLIGYRLTRVDPEALKATLMFDRDAEWGVYNPGDLGVAMRDQLRMGRRFDADAARVTRDLFGSGTLPDLRAALGALLPERWRKEWAL